MNMLPWDVTYFLNGWLFNRIPLLKKLKWREVLSCRGLYGNLSDKNNPAFQRRICSVFLAGQHYNGAYAIRGGGCRC